MDEIEAVKRRLKNKKYNQTNNNNSKENNYINGLISRVLIGVIVFFLIIILANSNKDINKFIKNDVLKDNISFTKVSNLYNKYFGSVVPIKDVGNESETVFNEKIVYKKLNDYKDGYELKVSENYLVPIINSGIVVFIGEKEGYGNTVIIQGIDEVDYWYGNIKDVNVSLYDYVSKGGMLGTTDKDKLYLVFQKNGEYLGYDEIME